MEDLPVVQEFGHSAGDAGGVGDPDGFGDEETVDFLGLAHQGAAVGGEGEDAVEAVLDFAFAQGGKQLLGGLPGGEEVLQR